MNSLFSLVAYLAVLALLPQTSPAQVPFLQSPSATTLRNNYTGFVGMEFTTGATPVVVAQLGRYVATGNSQSHSVKLVNANQSDVAGGSVILSLNGATPGRYAYAPLVSPITLAANTQYYLVSAEVSGGDQWYDLGPVAGASAATVNGPVYTDGHGAYQVVVLSTPSQSYVPVNFVYGGSTVAPPTVSITAPASGSASGSITLAASASAASGRSITGVQFQLNGTNFGPLLNTAPYSTALDTTTIANGTYALTAVATDSGGGSAFSTPVQITIADGFAATPFLSGPPSASLRNNFSGFVGMGFITGSAAVTLSELGRYAVSGNSQSHIVKLVNANGVDVPGGSVTVPLGGAPAGQYIYAPLPSPITLPAKTTYFLVSHEVSGGDGWYDIGPVTGTTAASVNYPVYTDDHGTYISITQGTPNSSYVPVNFLYSSAGASAPPSVSITSPAAGPVSGVVTLTASATAATGLSITGVQFRLNGGNLGSLLSTAPYISSFDTATLANGTYTLVAVATDSNGGSTTSAPVSLTVSGGSAATSFISGQPAASLRNNYSGFVGMAFTTGSGAVTLTQLGRYVLPGNFQTHVVKLVNANGSAVSGGSVTVSLSGATPGQYAYAPLTSLITLAPHTQYYLFSQEVSGGDGWYDIGPVTGTAAAAVNYPAYIDDRGVDVLVTQSTPGTSYVPVNFQYTAQPVSGSPAVTIVSPAPLTVLSGVVTVTAQAMAAPGLSIASVQLQRTGTNIGLPVTGAGPDFSTTLDTRLLVNGPYILSGIAIDSAGNTTFGPGITVSVSNTIGTPTVSVTTPQAGSNGTGVISVTATAVPAAGTTLSSLQLSVDGQNFGAPCSSASCTALLDTTLLPNGTHALTATAIDSDEGQAISAPVSITAVNTVTGIGVLNGFLPGVARNYGGWIGMQFTTGCTALSVTSLGRIDVPGNTGTHLLKLVLASTGADVPGGSATVAFTGAIANRIAYARLAAPVTLAANTAYYLVSQETATGDQFYDYEPILTDGAVTVNGPAHMESGAWITTQSPNYIYVPVDFQFTVPGVPFPGPVTLPPVVSPVTPNSGIVPAAFNHILIDGQSLSVGGTGGPPLSLTQPYSNVMLNNNDAAFLPLIEGVGAGYQVNPNVETIGSALGNTITRLSANNAFTDIVTNAGVPGYPYAQLEKGTAPYTAAIAQVSAAKTLAIAAGKTYKFSGVTVVHGETDEGAGVTAAAYEADLVQWQNNFQTDGRAISGQSDSVPFFIDQENSWTYSNLATPTVAFGQLSAAEDNPSTIFLIGPKYQYHYNDGIHIDNVSYRKEGEQFGKAISQILLSGVARKPFAPKTITRSGNVITAQFNVPAPPLRFDTSTVLPKSAMGFEYSDGSACSPFIVSAQITAMDTITFTLSAVPAGSNEHLRYAFTGIPGSFAGRDEPGSAHGNLKDSDSTVSAYGNDLSNWAVAFDKMVTASK